MKMPHLCTLLGVTLACAASIQAATFVLEDDQGGNSFGDTDGMVIDIDTTYNSLWAPDLVAGQQYSLDSISFYENSANTVPVYLSVFGPVFSGFDGDTAAEHLGFSTNSIVFNATSNGTLVTYNFSGITVAADSSGWLSGSGVLYFTWDTDTTRNNNATSGGPNPVFRMNAGDPSANLGAAIFAFGAVQASRSPEIQVQLTAIPEPSSSAVIVASLGMLSFVRRKA